MSQQPEVMLSQPEKHPGDFVEVEDEVASTSAERIVLSEEAFQVFVADLVAEPEPPLEKLLAAITDYKNRFSGTKTTC